MWGSLFPGIVFAIVLFAILKFVKPGSLGGSQTRELDDELPPQSDRFVEATARLEHRVAAIERIIAADNPNWRA